jgi:pilus assembly protein Flp/PilA
LLQLRFAAADYQRVSSPTTDGGWRRSTSENTIGGLLFPDLRRTAMRQLAWAIHGILHGLLSREEGQDLVEYALVIAMMAFACITSMGFLARSISNEFSTVGTTLTSSL